GVMMDPLFLILISILMVVLVGVSAYFACSETAYTGMNAIRVKNLVYEGRKNADKALKIYEDYDRLLTTALVGNTVVNIAISSLGTMLFSELFGAAMGVVVATIVTATIILTFAEVIPKTLAKRNAERYSLRLAGSLYTVMTIVLPITWVFIKLTNFLSKNAKNDSEDIPSFTEDELHVMIDEVTEEGALERSEGELIKSAMQFDDIKVSEMYTPRSNITAVNLKADIEEVKELFLESEYSRIPVFDKSVDRIIGAIHTKDFFSRYVSGEPFTLNDIIMPVKFVPESTSIAALLSDLQKTHIHMAIVLDNFGRTLGLVTMEDILEELVGDIWDEGDEAVYPIHKEKDGSYTVPGEANISEIMNRLGIEFDAGDLKGQSINAFVHQNINGVPKRGDKIELENCRIVVRSMKSRRIKEVRICTIKEDGTTCQELPEN
ncbi:MAG: hemolysin family protein, partial [Candidatus Methanoplasma sp.]|nr:hemolysin family protein [Candidatus Methanoplasma sp.]